jgi:hypothetical protein
MDELSEIRGIEGGMVHYLALAFLFVLVALAGLGALVFPCGAQAPPATPTPPAVQNQPNQLPQARALPSIQNATVPGPANAAPAPGIVGTTTSSSAGKTFGSVGGGLPGMPGGPPLNGSPGSQDPASQYNIPPMIPPVLCDPAVNIPC